MKKIGNLTKRDMVIIINKEKLGEDMFKKMKIVGTQKEINMLTSTWNKKDQTIANHLF